MDAKMDSARPAVHISIETYLNYIAQGIFPSRILDNRPLDDFVQDGQKYIIDLETPDQDFLFPEGDFEQIISSNPSYVEKLMNQFQHAIDNFDEVLNRVLDGDIYLLEEKRTILQQAYLFKINSRNDPPFFLSNDMQKTIFFRDFCHQVAQAFVAGRRPKNFKQFAATRPKNLNRMRGMVTYLTIGRMSKRQLYAWFIENRDYINAHALTLLPEEDLKLQLLTSILTTYNEAVSQLDKLRTLQTSRYKLSRFDIKLFGVSTNVSYKFEQIALSKSLTVEYVLKYIVNLLKSLNDSMKDKKTMAVMEVLQANVFFVKLIEDTDMPANIADKIQEYLDQNHPIDIGSHRLIN